MRADWRAGAWPEAAALGLRPAAVHVEVSAPRRDLPDTVAGALEWASLFADLFDVVPELTVSSGAAHGVLSADALVVVRVDVAEVARLRVQTLGEERVEVDAGPRGARVAVTSTAGALVLPPRFAQCSSTPSVVERAQRVETPRAPLLARLAARIVVGIDGADDRHR